MTSHNQIEDGFSSPVGFQCFCKCNARLYLWGDGQNENANIYLKLNYNGMQDILHAQLLIYTTQEDMASLWFNSMPYDSAAKILVSNKLVTAKCPL